jgi:hypothetical protein
MLQCAHHLALGVFEHCTFLSLPVHRRCISQCKAVNKYRILVKTHPASENVFQKFFLFLLDGKTKYLWVAFRPMNTWVMQDIWCLWCRWSRLTAVQNTLSATSNFQPLLRCYQISFLLLLKESLPYFRTITFPFDINTINSSTSGNSKLKFLIIHRYILVYLILNKYFVIKCITQKETVTLTNKWQWGGRYCT